MISRSQMKALRTAYGTRLQENVPLKRHTAARIGGAADVIIAVASADELINITTFCWEKRIPFIILGSGSNVLISDRGVRQLVILNQSRKVTFNVDVQPASVWAESGVNFGSLARRAAAKGLSGLEWAAGIPGTVGGAVVGNAGAHGGDMSASLLVAKILHLIPENGDHRQEILPEEWSVDRFEYGYRSSSIKRHPGEVVVLSAQLKLIQSTLETVKSKMEEYRMMRKSSQPSGASLGSIFKNPPGDYAGRLIEAAGLKGTRMGKVEISHKHANFFINQDSASAQDYAALIRLAQEKVREKFNVSLELEVELLGDWSDR